MFELHGVTIRIILSEMCSRITKLWQDKGKQREWSCLRKWGKFLGWDIDRSLASHRSSRDSSDKVKTNLFREIYIPWAEFSPSWKTNQPARCGVVSFADLDIPPC